MPTKHTDWQAAFRDVAERLKARQATNRAVEQLLDGPKVMEAEPGEGVRFPHQPAPALTFPPGGKPASEVDHFFPLLVWDDYHGFVVGKRDPVNPSHPWRLDLPYGCEDGGCEIALYQVRLWWPLPPNPRIGAAAARPG